MPQTRDEILQAALQLSDADRLMIGHRLLDNISDDFPGLDFDDPELFAELERRSQDDEGSLLWSTLRDVWPTPATSGDTPGELK